MAAGLLYSSPVWRRRDVTSLTEGILRKQLCELPGAKIEAIGSKCPERHIPAKPRKLAEWHRSSRGFWDLEPREDAAEAQAKAPAPGNFRAATVCSTSDF